MIIKEYKLVRTCMACPEQYDVFNKQGDRVGYLRLRHGYFAAEYPYCNGELVYEAFTKGDGIFEDYERETHLQNAISAIDKRINGN